MGAITFLPNIGGEFEKHKFSEKSFVSQIYSNVEEGVIYSLPKLDLDIVPKINKYYTWAYFDKLIILFSCTNNKILKLF